MNKLSEKYLNSEPPLNMMAVVNMNNGGYDKLQYKSVLTPIPSEDEALIRVLAAGVNNTEINTRLGWYSSNVDSGTGSLSLSQNNPQEVNVDGGWNNSTPFPIIQGTDCCGEVVALGSLKHKKLLGARVLVRACIKPEGFHSTNNIWMGSDFDGAFAQYVKVPITEVFSINSDWSNAELATIPCAYGTAENMLHRAKCGAGDHVFVVGASGGVGSAAIQLAKIRGSYVTAFTTISKSESVKSIGADQVITRENDMLSSLGEESVDLVIDNVAGTNFSRMLKILRRGGKYVSSGAIAGPIVSLDMRDMYLKDITLFGTTAWDEVVFSNLIAYIEADKIKPLLAKTFPLSKIAKAQKEFITKKHVGNFVLIP